MLGDQSDARQRIWTVLDSNSDFRLVRVEGGLVKASVRANSLSWGEQITVSLTQGAEGADVVVRSECSFPLQIFDWGKNKENVERILRGLAAHFGEQDR